MVFVGEQPLYGWGMGASRGLFLETIGLGGGHNAIVNALVDTGVLGAGLWLAMVLTVVVLAARVPAAVAGARWDRAVILGVIAFLLTDSIFTEGPAVAGNSASTWLLILVAWVDVLRADVRATEELPEPAVAHAVAPVVQAVPLQTRYSRRPPV